jgi:hypothetical protein
MALSRVKFAGIDSDIFTSGVADSAQVQSQFDSAFPSAFDTRFASQDTHDSAAVAGQISATFPSITDNGNVGIGIATPADELHVNSTGANVNLRLTRDSSTGASITASDGADTPAIRFDTIASGVGTERMRIDQNGNVGIGTTNPTGVFADTVVRVAGDSGAEIILRRNDTGVVSGDYIGGFLFNNGDASGDPPHYAGMVGRAHTIYGPTQLEFYSGRGSVEDSSAVPHMLIKAGTDEDVVVGINVESPVDKLHVHDDNGGSVIRITSSDTGTTSSDGFHLGLDAAGGAYLVQNESQPLYVYTGGSQRARFDADGLKFGSDTAAANALDDYEEGTWTPTLGTGTITSYEANYTKIGNIVQMQIYINGVSDITTAANFTLSLPFTSKSNARSAGSIMFRYINSGGAVSSGDDSQVTPYVSSGSSTLYLYVCRNQGGSYVTVQHNDFTNIGLDMFITLTYIAA